MSISAAPIGVSAYVAHARHVPSEVRERFASAASTIATDARAIVVHTCHRVELYVAPGDDGSSEGRGLIIPELPVGGLVLHGADAARHLFSVAAGLDSVVVGEDQVMHQVRECFTARRSAALDESEAENALGQRLQFAPEGADNLVPILDRLFQLALHVGRQTRSWREDPPRSLADVALDRIEASGSIDGRPVLVVGAGQMGRLVALAAKRHGAAVVITTRTERHAARLAADIGGTSVPFGAVPETAGVIVALAGEWSVDASTAQRLTEAAVTVVDLSSPPAVPGALRAALGSGYVSVDDVARVPGRAMRPRLRRRVEHLLDEAVGELSRWAAARDAVPAMVTLTERAEARRAAEVERLLRRLPDLPEHERDLVDQMSRRLVAGILHAPLISLRDDHDGARERAARELFSL